ncbi:Trehalose-6-P synthase/phosphatase complex subunit [Tilletia horrida]|nr:Trehalose-6-P synthase/phosphatase complex subunit [Tilletia horrida]
MVNTTTAKQAPAPPPPPPPPVHPHPHAGHRLLIVSLFLRETIQFHPFPQDEQQQQQHLSQQEHNEVSFPYEDQPPPSTISTTATAASAQQRQQAVLHEEEDHQTDKQTPAPATATDDIAPPSFINTAGRRGSQPYTSITPHHPHADPATLTADLLIADPATQQQAQLQLHEELTAHASRTQPAPPSPPEPLGNPGDGPYIPSTAAGGEGGAGGASASTAATGSSGPGGAGGSQTPLAIHELPARLHSFTLSHPPHTASAVAAYSHHHSLSTSSHSTSASRRASSTSAKFRAGFFAHSIDLAGNSRSSSTGTATAPDMTALTPKNAHPSSSSNSSSHHPYHHHASASTGSAGSAGTLSAGGGGGGGGGAGGGGASSSGTGPAPVGPLSIINDLVSKQQQKHNAAAAAAAAAITTGAGVGSGGNTGGAGAGGSNGAGPSTANTNSSTTAAPGTSPHTPSLLQTEARHNPFATATTPSSTAAGIASGTVTPRRTSSPMGGSTTPGGLPGSRLSALTSMTRTSSGAGSGSAGASVGSPGGIISASPGAGSGEGAGAGATTVKPRPKSFLQQTLSRPPAGLTTLSSLKKEGAGTGTASGGATPSAPTQPPASPSTAYPGATPAAAAASGGPAAGSAAALHRQAAGASMLSRSASSGPGGTAHTAAAAAAAERKAPGTAGGVPLTKKSASTGASTLVGGAADDESPQAFSVVHDHGRAAPAPASTVASLPPAAAGAGASGAGLASSPLVGTPSGHIRPEHVFASVPPSSPSTTSTTNPSPSVTNVSGLGIQTASTGSAGASAVEMGSLATSASSLSASVASLASSSGATSSNGGTPATATPTSSSAENTPQEIASPTTEEGASPRSGAKVESRAAGSSAPAAAAAAATSGPGATPQKRTGRERGPAAHMLPSSSSMATSRPKGSSRTRSRTRHHGHHHHHHHGVPLPRRTSSVASLESHQSAGTVTTTTSAAGMGREVGSCITPTSEHPDEENSSGAADGTARSGDGSSSAAAASAPAASAVAPEQAQEEYEILPPFDFVPNPSANGGLFNAVESLGTLGQGRYGAKGRMKAGTTKGAGTGNATPTPNPGTGSAAPGLGGSAVGSGLGGGGDRGAVMRRSTNRLFIGTLGISLDGWLGPDEQSLIERRLGEERQAVPVWVDDATFERSYHDFCKALLWPTFHYTLPSERALEKQHEAFRSYIDVNRAFADRIAEHWREGDIVHLLLVPQMLRERLGPSATIGLFMHISFPSSEIFRCLSVRETLLRGMMGADLLGFQTSHACRHFRQTVSRILQLEATPKGIQLDTISGRGGFVSVTAFPIGIDVRSLNLKRREPEVKEWIQRLQTRYEGRKIIVGRDKLDWIKGVRQKLLAYELFLEDHPEWVGQVVLIQVALATTEENEEAGQASDVVARINRRWGSLTYQPVVFLHVQDITFSQYLALLTVADAFLASSLREGMALTPHEYIICQEVKHRPLILSEFVGSYSSLRACLGFNPFNTKQASLAIYKALTMDEDEMTQRWQDMHRTVVTQTAQHWITSFLSRLERAHAEQQFRDTAFIPRLEIAQLVSEWRAAKTRLILLDLEDTLVSETPLSLHKHGFRPSAKLLERLCALTADAKNSVYVLSGMGMANLNGLAEAVPRLGLIAENGCFVKHCGDGGERSWISLVAGFNLQWRPPVKDILAYFTERTPGSWMEDRGASICWVYWNEELGEAGSHEAQWARRQAAEVQNLIYDSLAERFSLRITPGPASFLCSPKNTSRASAVQHIMQLSAMGGFWAGGNMVVPGQIVDPNSNAGSSAVGGGSVGGAGLGASRTGLGMSMGIGAGGNSSSSTVASNTQADAAASRNKSQLDAVLREEAIKTSGRAQPGQLPNASDLPYKLPSNHWPVPQPSAPRSAAKDKVAMETTPGVRNLQGLFGFGPAAAAAAAAHPLQPNAGSFDFVLAIGQDEGLLRYVNGLDLPFAPVTCTTVDLTRSKGSDAGNHLEGVEEVEEALDEILEFRERDRRWGRPAMTDV